MLRRSRISTVADTLSNLPRNPKVGALLVDLHKQMENRSVQEKIIHPQLYSHLAVETVAEHLFTTQITEQQRDAFVSQVVDGIVVPIVVEEEDTHYTEVEVFLMDRLLVGLFDSLKACNPFALKIFKRHSVRVTMMPKQFTTLFDKVPQYVYPGRKVTNTPRSMTKILTREMFIQLFGPNVKNYWFKEVNRHRYTVYLKFPLILSYNVKKFTAQFHFLVSIYSNADGRKVEKNYIARRPVRCSAPRRPATKRKQPETSRDSLKRRRVSTN